MPPPADASADPARTPTARSWFDGHLDLAYLAETGRDMHAEPAQARGRYRPAAVTLPSLRAGRVTACHATVFTEPLEPGGPPDDSPFMYPPGDAPGARLAAWRAGQRQLRLYHAWHDAGLIALAGREPPAERHPSAPAEPLAVRVLMENADPIETPEQLAEWRDAGVAAIGLTWTRRGRYASGDRVPSGDPGSGLTDAGRELLAAAAALGVAVDVSHLNDRSLRDTLEAFAGPVIASHANARALLPGLDAVRAQRHLADDTLSEIGRRGGVVGINLFSAFLDPARKEGGRAALERVLDQADHARELAGDGSVALGSDADGGFAADRLAEGIDAPADYSKLTEGLRGRGWDDARLDGFASANWHAFWRRQNAGPGAATGPEPNP